MRRERAPERRGARLLAARRGGGEQRGAYDRIAREHVDAVAVGERRAQRVVVEGLAPRRHMVEHAKEPQAGRRVAKNKRLLVIWTVQDEVGPY